MVGSELAGIRTDDIVGSGAAKQVRINIILVRDNRLDAEIVRQFQCREKLVTNARGNGQVVSDLPAVGYIKRVVRISVGLDIGSDFKIRRSAIRQVIT